MYTLTHTTQKHKHTGKATHTLGRIGKIFVCCVVGSAHKNHICYANDDRLGQAERERELRRDDEEAGEVSTVLCGIATMRKHGTNTSGRCGAMCDVRCVNTASILAKNSPRFALLLHCTNPTGNATLFAFSIVLSLSLLPCFVLSFTQFVCIIEV